MPIISPFKRRFYDEAIEEPFNGEDMLPFVSNLYEDLPTEELEENVSEKTENKITGQEKVKRYFWKSIVNKVFKL